jgi:hypothetical protein
MSGQTDADEANADLGINIAPASEVGMSRLEKDDKKEVGFTNRP